MQFGLIRRLAAVLVALAVACALPAAAQPAPYTIPVILSLSGPAANLGQDEANGLAAYEKFFNANGGIRGTPVHFDVHDDQSQPAVAVQLFQQILTTHPAVVLGSAIAAQTQAMAALVKDQVVLYSLTPNMNPTRTGFPLSRNSCIRRNEDGLPPAMPTLVMPRAEYCLKQFR